MSNIKIGERVTYNPGYKTEKGIVKGFASDGDPFVVYNCGGDWENYQNYTGAKTPIKHLKKEWNEQD